MTDTTSLSQGVARQMPGQVRRISICVLHVFDRDWLTAAFNLANLCAGYGGIQPRAAATFPPRRAENYAGLAKLLPPVGSRSHGVARIEARSAAGRGPGNGRYHVHAVAEPTRSSWCVAST